MQGLEQIKNRDLDRVVKLCTRDDSPVTFYDSNEIRKYFDNVELPILKNPRLQGWSVLANIKKDKEDVAEMFMSYETKLDLIVGFSLQQFSGDVIVWIKDTKRWEQIKQGIVKSTPELEKIEPLYNEIKKDLESPMDDWEDIQHSIFREEIDKLVGQLQELKKRSMHMRKVR